MTHKRFTLLLQSTLHSLVFLSLCLAPLLHNVLYNLQNEVVIERESQIKNKAIEDSLNSKESSTNPSEIGLNNSLKDFWSLTRLSQRYFAQRKNTTSFSLYNKVLQNTTQSVLRTDSNISIEEPIGYLADSKRYLSQAKLQLEGG